MGRPTKEETEKRKIFAKYLTRNSVIYSNFEEITRGLTDNEVAYYFVNACNLRSKAKDGGAITGTFIYKPKGKDKGWGLDSWNIKTFQDLKDIDNLKHKYYSSILAHAESRVYKERNKKKYITRYTIEEDILIKIIGEERAKEVKSNIVPNDLGYLLRYELTDIEIKKVKKYINIKPFGVKTIIQRNYTLNNSLLKVAVHRIKENTLSVELDFTRSLDEINHYIQHLHEEYQKNNIKNIFDVLGIEQEKRKQEVIFSTNAHKPFNGLLSDKLFIYDSRKMGLTIEEIREEIIKYWTKTKKISEDKITKDTILDYYKSTKKFIENEEYKKFLNGYN